MVGDVLVLLTGQSFSIYAIRPVYRDGQQDFQGQTNVKYVTGRDAAAAEAKDVVIPGRRMFLSNIDTDEWSEILDSCLVGVGPNACARPSSSAPNNGSPIYERNRRSHG